ncbi:hypothetical protein OSB04_un001455 [Centaurea solstitialis]|uniref:Uncharacterized protein n=1 Tax=Centaurea solstitialis TaxID=347529 RepID=A0AA38W2L5_9ASTR|nr:hypothetical protein OSB04_un001455 [Centaurea solstitialis]
MGESLTEQCRVEVEGPRVMNFFSRRRSNDASANSVPAAAVIQRMQALSGMIGRKASVVRRQIPGLNSGQAVETSKLEYGRGRGNFRWSGEMRRDRKEHQRRKHSAGPTLTLRDES